MKKTILVLLICSVLVPLLGLPIEATLTEHASVESAVKQYFALRQTAVERHSFEAMTRSIGNRVSDAVIQGEERRVKHLEDMANKAGIRLLGARSTASVKDIAKITDGLVKVNVYEWTFFDYEENGCNDFFGMGIWHELVVSLGNGRASIIEHRYDEGPLTGMSVGYTLAMAEEATKCDTDLYFGVAPMESTLSSAVKFSRSGVASYADRWVYNQAYNGLWEQYCYC